jgi:hypothetical protein
MKKTHKKLALHIENVRVLNDSDLGSVNGATTAMTCTQTSRLACHTLTCTTR